MHSCYLFTRAVPAEALAALRPLPPATGTATAAQWGGTSAQQRQGITAATVDYSEDFESYRRVVVFFADVTRDA